MMNERIEVARKLEETVSPHESITSQLSIVNAEVISMWEHMTSDGLEDIIRYVVMVKANLEKAKASMESVEKSRSTMFSSVSEFRNQI